MSGTAVKRTRLVQFYILEYMAGSKSGVLAGDELNEAGDP
jgi:hypothetical protein